MARAAGRGTAGKRAAPDVSKPRPQKTGRRGTVPHYSQTTDFTCGPSALLMAMRTLDPKSDFSRAHELQLYRVGEVRPATRRPEAPLNINEKKSEV